MYGKVFESMYEGSLYGHFEAIVTFQALIVLADENGIVDYTPEALAGRTSYPLEVIQKGLDELTQPDPFSRSSDHDGRRLTPIDPGRNWGWIIVNYGHYRDLASRQDRAEYQKQYYLDHKGQDSTGVNNPQQPSTDSRHTDTDTDTLKHKVKCFDLFWSQYPKKVKKKAAKSAFQRLSQKDIDALLAHLPDRIQDPQFKKFTPHPTTFINQRLWEDEDWKTEESESLRQKSDKDLLDIARQKGLGTAGLTREQLISKLEAA